MKNILLLTALVSSFLVGCATIPGASQSELTQDDYVNYGEAFGLLDACLYQSFMDGETHAKAMSVFNEGFVITNKIVDRNKINVLKSNARSRIEREAPPQELRFECQRISGMVQVDYREIQEQKRNNQINNQRSVYTPTYNKSSTTSCNQFGSQVICNTF